MPDAYLFDIGNVILRFDFLKATRKLELFSSVSAEDSLPLVAPLLIELELGAISPAEFIASASARMGFTGDAAFFESTLADIFDLNLPMVEFINARKAKAKLSFSSRIRMESTFPFSKKPIRFLNSLISASTPMRSGS